MSSLHRTVAARRSRAVAVTPRALRPRPSQPAVRELGYAASPMQAGGWWLIDGADLAEQTPELRWPLNLAVYDAMVRQDSQVSSTLRAVTHPIFGTTWRLDPNGAPDHVVEHCAVDLGLPIKGREDVAPGRLRDRFSWPWHLRHAMLKLRYGHMVFEQVYRYDEAADLYHLRKLGPRMPRTISEWSIARDGGLQAVQQHGADRPMPVSRLVVYVNEQEAGNWTGTSLLRPAYKNWLLKDRILRTQTTSIDRNGLGVPVYTGSQNNDDEELERGEDIATGLRAGDNSGASIPNGADLELLGVTGELPDTLEPVRYHDEQIARAVLAHFLNLGTQTGSWALGSTFADFFVQSLQAVAQDTAHTATAHIVEDIVDINYGPDMPAPKIVFDEIGSNSAAIATAIKTLVDAGVLTADEGLEAHVRLGLGLPTKSQENAQ